MFSEDTDELKEYDSNESHSNLLINKNKKMNVYSILHQETTMITNEINEIPKKKSFSFLDSGLDSDNANNEEKCTPLIRNNHESNINKTVLRALRRFYLNLFKADNRKMVK